MEPRDAGDRDPSLESLKVYFEHIFANSRDVMNLISLTRGKIIMLNEAAAHHTGYSLADLAELPVETLYPPEELPKLTLAFERLHSTGASSDKLRMYVRSGELRDIWTRSFVVQRHPEVICLVHTIDITEENRRQERELRNARLATLGESSATMAHELKNALQSMQYNLAALRARVEAGNVERTETILRRLERAASHMDDVIAGIQAASRVSGKRAAFVSLPTCVNAALGIMSGYLEVKGIEVERRFQEAQSLAWAERVQVEQILIILIKNAVQAMASRDERKLTISLQEKAGMVRLDLSDTGGGLPEEVQARMFESFVTTKPAGVGIGLGLATARQLAANGGIQLSFTTSPGVGTTFSLEFRTTEGRAPKEAEGASGKPVLNGKNLLIVGEDATALEAASSALTAAGAHVLVATTASEAMRVVRVHAIEALICDDAMYPVPVDTFIRQLRAVYRGPVCLLSNGGPQRATLLDTWIAHSMPKPVDAPALVHAIAGIVA